MYDILLKCCSEAGAGVKAEEDFDIPEDTQYSMEEEELLQKQTGEEEIMPSLSSTEPQHIELYNKTTVIHNVHGVPIPIPNLPTHLIVCCLV